jgi:glycosyltransferase involved in cell wall biosynthesis
MASGSGELPRVLHFTQQWLPLSEPFVYALVTNSAHPGLVVSSRPLDNAELFPYDPRYSLGWLSEASRFRHRVVTASLMVLAWRYAVRLVHVHHGYEADAVIGTCRRRGLPMVLSLHGHDITGCVEEKPDIYNRVTGAVDAVIVPSQYLLEVAAAAGFPRERLHVIPSGVDTRRFAPSPLTDGSHEVLFVGRFVEKKGLDVLLEAWPRVRERVPDARLRILGFGPLEDVARSGGPDVEVIIRPDQEAVRDAIRRASVVVSPSKTAGDDSVESLLLVNLEAQASGRPVVTTRHGGIPEYVRDGETALVVPENDPGAVADALVRVLVDRDLARRLGAAGPPWVQQFDARRSAERVDALYRSLLDARGVHVNDTVVP